MQDEGASQQTSLRRQPLHGFARAQAPALHTSPLAALPCPAMLPSRGSFLTRCCGACGGRLNSEELHQPLFAAIDAFEFPELHDESIAARNFYRHLAKLMAACGVKDFGMKVSASKASAANNVADASSRKNGGIACCLHLSDPECNTSAGMIECRRFAVLVCELCV